MEQYEIIDSHVHIRGFNDGDVLGIINGIYEIKKQTLLRTLNVASIPAWDYESAGQNALCLLYKAKYPDCYAYAGLDHYIAGVDKTPQGRVTQLKRFMKMGFDGIKSIEYKPTARREIKKGLNDPEYDLFFKHLEQEQIPVLWHVADPAVNWNAKLCSDGIKACGWCYADSSFLSKQELYNEVEEVITRYPKLNVVFAHLYFLSEDIQKAYNFMKRFPNVLLDVTPGIEMYYDFSKDRKAWRNFFLDFADRIVLGTDNGWGDDITPATKVEYGKNGIYFITHFFGTDEVLTTWEGKQVQGLQLPEDVLQKLFADNFMKMQHNKQPKSIDLSMALEYCIELYEGMTKNPKIPQEPVKQVKTICNIFEKMTKRL